MGKAVFHYSEKEVGHMQFWKYMELFEVYKEFHNALAARMIYKTEEIKEDEETEKEVVYF